MKVFTPFFSAGKHGETTEKLYPWKIPRVDAVRDLLSRIDPKEIEEIHAQTIDVLKRNRVFREGTIGGYVAAGIDGVELFSSTKSPVQTA